MHAQFVGNVRKAVHEIEKREQAAAEAAEAAEQEEMLKVARLEPPLSLAIQRTCSTFALRHSQYLHPAGSPELVPCVAGQTHVCWHTACLAFGHCTFLPEQLALSLRHSLLCM